jgi:FKBP-type peptidyl-prolyl cis-trans isomerase 2/predicted Fe-Mo cluster-binding NifX family protein
VLIAVPSDSTDGLEATISAHFGHCAAFTLVNIDDGAIGEVSILDNTAHEEGGCMAPVNLLKAHGVGVLLAGGMGVRPLAGFQQVGIDVHHSGSAGSVGEAVDLFLAGGCPAFGEAQTCGGGGGECGGHHHHHHQEELRTVPIEGTADAREGRLITLEYELQDIDGNVIDASSRTGPIRFIFGSGQVLPAIEAAVAGLEPGAQVMRQVPAAEGFGERDAARVVEVPRSQLPPDAAVGAVITAEDGQGRRFPLTIVELGESTVTLDANHPLAGKDLVFDLTVRSVEGVAPHAEQPR